MNQNLVQKLKVSFNDLEKIKILYKLTSQELDEQIYNLLNFKLKSDELIKLQFKIWINYEESFLNIKDIKSLILNNKSIELNDGNKLVLKDGSSNLLTYINYEKDKYNNKFILAKNMSEFAIKSDNQENISLTSEFLNKVEKLHSVIVLLEDKINEIKNTINELLKEK